MGIRLARATLPAWLTGNLLTVGEETAPRLTVSGAGGASSQQLRLSYFTARKSETSTQVRIWTGGTAAGATPTLARIGMYEIDAAGAGVLVASTVSDTTLFAATSTAYTRSWSSSFMKTAGKRYALGVLVVSAATMPVWAATPLFQPVESGMSPRLAGSISGQSDLPASFAEVSVGVSATHVYAAILP